MITLKKEKEKKKKACQRIGAESGKIYSNQGLIQLGHKK